MAEKINNPIYGSKEFWRRGKSVIVPSRTLVDILALFSQGDPTTLVRRNRVLIEEIKERAEIFEPCRQTLHILKGDQITLLHILAQRRLVKKPIQKIEKVVLTPAKYEQKFVKLCDYMAAVIAQTYVERGEDAVLADDEALMMLRELLCAFDETMILRNASKRTVIRLFRIGAKFVL